MSEYKVITSYDLKTATPSNKNDSHHSSRINTKKIKFLRIDEAQIERRRMDENSPEKPIGGGGPASEGRSDKWNKGPV